MRVDGILWTLFWFKVGSAEGKDFERTISVKILTGGSNKHFFTAQGHVGQLLLISRMDTMVQNIWSNYREIYVWCHLYKNKYRWTWKWKTKIYQLLFPLRWRVSKISLRGLQIIRALLLLCERVTILQKILLFLKFIRLNYNFKGYIWHFRNYKTFYIIF